MIWKERCKCYISLELWWWTSFLNTCVFQSAILRDDTGSYTLCHHVAMRCIHPFIHSSTNSFSSSYPQLYLTGSMLSKLFQPFISYSSQAFLLSPTRVIPRYSVVNEMYIFHPLSSDLPRRSPSSWKFQELLRWILGKMLFTWFDILTKLPQRELWHTWLYPLTIQALNCWPVP